MLFTRGGAGVGLRAPVELLGGRQVLNAPELISEPPLEGCGGGGCGGVSRLPPCGRGGRLARSRMTVWRWRKVLVLGRSWRRGRRRRRWLRRSLVGRCRGRGRGRDAGHCAGWGRWRWAAHLTPYLGIVRFVARGVGVETFRRMQVVSGWWGSSGGAGRRRWSGGGVLGAAPTRLRAHRLRGERVDGRWPRRN